MSKENKEKKNNYDFETLNKELKNLFNSQEAILLILEKCK